jgi:hypothetical protein
MAEHEPDRQEAPAGGNGERARIAELEAEVARLRGELGGAAAEEQPAAPADVAAAGIAPASRTKVLLVAIGIALAALAGFALIFYALSSGFDSLARKAAKSFAPDDDPGAGSGSASAPKREPQPREPAAPRAPGL